MSDGWVTPARLRAFLAAAAVALAGLGPAAGDDAAPAPGKPRKGSEAVRRNPMIRDFFRARAMSMQPTLKENDRTLNSTVDFLLDDFVERSLKLARKLTEDGEALYALAPHYRRLPGPPDRSVLADTRARAEAVKGTTKGLEAQMDFLVQALRLVIKVNEPDVRAMGLKQVGEDIERLHDLIDKFQVSLDEFMFPKQNAVALADLQKSALPVQLKRIERYADRIEAVTRRAR